MKNIGVKKPVSLFLILLLLAPFYSYPQDIEDSIHFRMLKKLNIEPEEESLLRRGEIVFFISFGYLWMYQFLLYDQVLSSNFNDKTKIGELSNKNLYFAILTSLVVALFIARNDNQFIYYIKNQKVYNYESKTLSYKEAYNKYDWYFNFFSWEF